MFHHVNKLNFNTRVSKPDVRFVKLLHEQFLFTQRRMTEEIQYYHHAFGFTSPNPDKYEMLMNIATKD